MPAQTCPYCQEGAVVDGRCQTCGEKEPPAQAPKPDDSRLKIAAVLQLVLGGMAALMVPCVAFGIVVQATAGPAGPRQDPLQALAGIAVYVVAAVFFVVTGIGAWRGRRWARPVMLAVMGPAIVLGVVGLVGAGFFAPALGEIMHEAMAMARGPGQPPPPGAMTAGLIIFGVIAFGMYVAVPAAFLGLYWSPKVQRTCEQLDPTERWTDHCPIPVLGLSLWLGFAAASTLLVPLYGMMPLFGVVVSGWAVLVPSVLLAAAFAGLAYAVYLRRPVGWWGTLGLALAGGASHVVTFLTVDMLDLYRAADVPKQQLEPMTKVSESNLDLMGLGMLVGGSLTLLIVLGYLLYLRRFFTATEPRP